MWSLGCVLYELATGQVLFTNGKILSVLEKMIEVIGDIPLEILTQGKFVHKYFELHHVPKQSNIPKKVEDIDLEKAASRVNAIPSATSSVGSPSTIVTPIEASATVVAPVANTSTTDTTTTR